MSDSINRLAKWRTLFAGWQIGTRTTDDPECQAIRDHREVTILLRAEVTALTGLLIHKGVFTAEEFSLALSEEAEHLNADYERRFPGASATDHGIAFDASRAQEIREWMGHWKP